MCKLAWWQVLLSWLLPFLLGWWFARLLKASHTTTQNENHDKCNEKISSLEMDIKKLHSKIHDIEADNNTYRADKLTYESRINSLTSQVATPVALQQDDTSKWTNKIAELEAQLSACHNNAKLLKIELDAANHRYSDLEKSMMDIAAQKSVTSAAAIVETVEPIVESKIESQIPDSAFAGLKSDNLQIVEGVGPKMDEFLKAMGISTWVELSEADSKIIKAKLEASDAKYRIIDPSTWPGQAKLAAAGKWYELIDLQKTLSAGKDGGDGETNSKLEANMIKLGLLKKFSTDDLKAIEGIGPKIEELLHNAGIMTWRELSNTSVDRINEILAAAGDRFQLADPGTWPKQAKMAADGAWKLLFEYQDRLQGGKEI